MSPRYSLPATAKNRRRFREWENQDAVKEPFLAMDYCGLEAVGVAGAAGMEAGVAGVTGCAVAGAL